MDHRRFITDIGQPPVDLLMDKVVKVKEQLPCWVTRAAS